MPGPAAPASIDRVTICVAGVRQVIGKRAAGPAGGFAGVAKTMSTNLLARVRGVFTKREEQLFLALAIVIGLLAGFSVVAFRKAIDFTRMHLLGAAPGPLRAVLVPALAGLVLAVLVLRFFPRVRGSGVNQTKAALYVYDGYIPFQTVTGKFIACALAIGTGQSLGPEDPSLQMGAGIASILGRRLRLSRSKLRLIAPVGAAAGLAAAFNAPISAVLFVIEEIIGTWSAGSLGAIVLAALASVVITRLFLGAQPLFEIPAYRMAHPSELLTYAVLGVVGGVLSICFVKLLALLRPRLRALPQWTYYLQPAVAGALIGAIGIRYPQVMGAGYDAMDQAMRGAFLWHVLLALALLKILATTLSFSSGVPGGLFAPTLFVGAMAGAAVGTLQHRFFPDFAGPIGAYALVGMGALFAGFLRTPFTSVFMVLEVSGNYSIIVPVMIANTIAYVIGRTFQRVPIFDLMTREDGIDLPSLEQGREQTVLRVEDAMRQPVGLILKASDTIGDAASRIADMTEDPLLVSYETGRWTFVRKAALEEAAAKGQSAQPLSGILSNPRLPRLHPDQTLDIALRLLRDAPFLPVVHRADARRLVGILSLADILAAYRQSSAGGGDGGE